MIELAQHAFKTQDETWRDMDIRNIGIESIGVLAIQKSFFSKSSGQIKSRLVDRYISTGYPCMGPKLGVAKVTFSCQSHADHEALHC